MKGFVISLVFVFALGAVFVAGVVSQSSGLMLAGFCVSPFALFLSGFMTARLFAGKRFRLESIEPTYVSNGQRERLRDPARSKPLTNNRPRPVAMPELGNEEAF
jgi:hypothetical protein